MQLADSMGNCEEPLIVLNCIVFTVIKTAQVSVMCLSHNGGVYIRDTRHDTACNKLQKCAIVLHGYVVNGMYVYESFKHFE